MKAVLTIKYGMKMYGKCCFDYKLPKDVLQKIGSQDAYKSLFQSSSSDTQVQPENATEIEEDLFDWDLADLE